jgi:thymidylate synthase (FAD)
VASGRATRHSLPLVGANAIRLISRFPFFFCRSVLASGFARMPTPRYYSEPVLTLLSRPSFVTPEHLPVAWIGESTDGERLAEFAGRLCYMSQHNPAKRETREYLENIKKQGHGSVLEHANYSILIEGVSRSLTHELVRHRAGFAYSQLSQRYVDESEASFVIPPAIVGDETLAAPWREQIEQAQVAYVELVAKLMERYGWVADRVHRRKMSREAARAVLPNATETKIVVTANARAWRTMLELRSSEGAELEIRRMAIAVLRLLQQEAPGFFSDFDIYVADDRREAAKIGYHKV